MLQLHKKPSISVNSHIFFRAQMFLHCVDNQNKQLYAKVDLGPVLLQ